VAFIDTVSPDRASGEVRAMYERYQATQGYVPNAVKVFSLRPGVMAGWNALLSSIRGNLDPRRYELITLAAARALRSSYCMLAHGAVLTRDFYSTEQLTAIAASRPTAELSPAETAMMAFAEKIARDASVITRADVESLRAHGLTDAEIFDVAATAAARCFFSKLIDALGAEPDSAYEDVGADLKRALTPGRGISAEPVERLP
jgi:uncharacterized peroxidase-related enzyme